MSRDIGDDVGGRPDSQEITIISWEDGDLENPYNWSKARKIAIFTLGTLVVLNSTVASSLPSLASPQLQRHFNITDEYQLVLPNSIFLVGYILGPLLWAPLSENYGRRFIIIGTYFMYMIWVLGSALAPTWTGFLFFRFLTGLFGSTPISLTGGLFADILDDPIWRGRSIAWFMATAAAGPAAAPIASGYLAEISWRWPFWFGLIFAGTCAPPLLFLPETFGPALLMAKARKLRKQNPGSNVYASLELVHKTPLQVVTQVLGRPLTMMVTEPIVSASCLYLSLIYGVIFMLFQAYAVIFPPIYGFSQGTTGLAFVPLALGCMIGMLPCFWWDSYLRRAKEQGRVWASQEEYNRLPLAILGGPLLSAGMFWIGWGARRNIHWIVPMLGGLPFGIGFVLIFVALFNYMVDAYKIYSASALGATSMARSTFGVVLPFAARPMYQRLGVGWACSLLGFLTLAMCLIPFVFIQYGERLRASSPVCVQLAQEAKERASISSARALGDPVANEANVEKL